jgi:hypothetical protein
LEEHCCGKEKIGHISTFNEADDASIWVLGPCCRGDCVSRMHGTFIYGR